MNLRRYSAPRNPDHIHWGAGIYPEADKKMLPQTATATRQNRFVLMENAEFVW
jgi:hypothetical protein